MLLVHKKAGGHATGFFARCADAYEQRREATALHSTEVPAVTAGLSPGNAGMQQQQHGCQAEPTPAALHSTSCSN